MTSHPTTPPPTHPHHQKKVLKLLLFRYWGYATKYALVAIQMLRSATGDTLGLEDAPGLATTGAWRIANTGPSDRSFNWGDR